MISGLELVSIDDCFLAIEVQFTIFLAPFSLVFHLDCVKTYPCSCYKVLFVDPFT